MKKLLISAAIIFLLSSCSQQIKTGDSLFVIEASPPSSYPGNSVKIVVENTQEMESVHLEYPTGTMIPMDRVDIPTWEINFMLPKDTTGKINLSIIGKPKDGSPIITQSFEYEIMEYPTINAKVVSESPDGVELEVKTSKPFKKVHIQVDDNKQIIFESAGDNTYKLKTKELDMENKNYVVSLEDENGIVFSSDLDYMPENLPYIYEIAYNRQATNTNYPLIKINPDTKKKILFKNLQINEINDDQLEKIKLRTKVDESSKLHFVSMSPFFDYVYINIVRDFVLQEKYVDSTGQILERVKAVYAVVYNLKTDYYELIGEPNYYKIYKKPRYDSKFVFKEEGPLFYFVRWEKENLILLEQRKDTKLIYITNHNDYWDDRSTKTTSKIVAYSISTKTFADNNEKPVTDWLCFSDPYTGIQGWALPMVRREFGFYTPIPYPYESSVAENAIIITVKGSQKSYNYLDLIPDKDNGSLHPFLDTRYTGLEDGKPFVFILATYLVYRNENGSEKSFTKTYKLFPLTGEFIHVGTWTKEVAADNSETITPKTDLFAGYSKYFTVKDGKIYANKKSNKYINPVDSINKIY